MEDLGLRHIQVAETFWHGKRIFVTGHTGFKGSWLSLWLQSMGAIVHGFAMSPVTEPSLFREAKVSEGMTETIADIRDFATLQSVLASFKPEIIIHLAAQPLVRYGYEFPLDTYSTNVMGTVNLLEAARLVGTAKVILNVTSDKCYENKEWLWGYREHDPMDGSDPYSNSKSCSELVTSAYRRSFFQSSGVAIASARAGNVIGGGDWAEDRLVPDLLRSFERGERMVIRNPRATRPWQHVLEPLHGYLLLMENLWHKGQEFSEAWNFGPNDDDTLSVEEITRKLCEMWGREADWVVDLSSGYREAQYLKLDISKTKNLLGWHPRWNLITALEKIKIWQQDWLTGKSAKFLCLDQIDDFKHASISIP